MTDNMTETKPVGTVPEPKPAADRAPAPNRKPGKKPRVGQQKKIPWGLLRLGAALLILLLVSLWVYPMTTDFVEEEYSSRAVSKGRVLLRGAQLVATAQLVDGDDWENAAQYLTDKQNLPEIAAAAKFPVEAVEITAATLDDKGQLERFECVLDYEYRRYSVVFDPAADRAEPTLLEKLDKPKEAKKSKTE